MRGRRRDCSRVPQEFDFEDEDEDEGGAEVRKRHPLQSAGNRRPIRCARRFTQRAASAKQEGNIVALMADDAGSPHRGTQLKVDQVARAPPAASPRRVCLSRSGPFGPEAGPGSATARC